MVKAMLTTSMATRPDRAYGPTNGPIRLVYVIDVMDTNMAGTENQLIKMINGIDKTRFEVHLLCFRHHSWLEANSASLDCHKTIIEIRRFRKAMTYWNLLRLIGYFRRLRPDIVHTFFPVANIVAVVAARIAGVPNVISSRRDYGEWMTRSYLRFTRLANRFASAIIANSSNVKALTVGAEGVDEGKVKVFFNGLDIAPFRNIPEDPGLKQRLGIPERNRVVGIVANFRPMKRHYTFVRAAREVLKARDDVDFVLIGGTGSKKEDTEALARSLGIAHKLHFAGSQPDVLPFLAMMDVGVNCSEAEGLSNAVMEYMAAGVPCVVSDSGGNPDLITHDVNGYVFPLDDYHGLAGYILTLLADDAKRKTFVARSHDKIERELTVPVMLANYERYYQTLAGCS